MTPRVAYLASEMSPFAKTGGLADVARALPAALRELNVDVRAFLPLYRSIDTGEHPLEPVFGPMILSLVDESITYWVYQGRIPRSETPVYFIHCPRLFDRGSLYTEDSDEWLRFLFFCRAAIETCQRLGFAPSVLHVNDWQTALAPFLLKTIYAWDRLFGETRSLLTIHNLAYQGVFGSHVLGAVGVSDWSLLDRGDLDSGIVNFLKTGLQWADLLSTVSPTYANEIQTPEQGYGLDGILRARRDELVGILNGVDYSEWNPANDAYIPFGYSDKSLGRKLENKDSLLEELGIPGAKDQPLLGMISRLAWQKGIELLPGALPELLERERFGLVVLGSGEQQYESFFTWLQNRFPERVCFYRGYSEKLAHWIEAGADMFLMPSRYEPSGLNQMYSLKYGTVPIVRKTGGLADSVQMFDPGTGEGTGIVFDHFTSDAVRWGVRTALELYRSPELWRRLMLNGMAQDFSWRHQAERYLAIYRRLLIH